MIQIDNGNKVIEGGVAIDVAEYHIDPSSVQHITAILRDMYSEPTKAVLREYLANAMDAHAEAKQMRPIEIKLPTPLEPTFQVRDFGNGLDTEAVKRLLYGYGASGDHKRQSNDQIGGFGIGCKCAFSVADAFTYSVYHGGRKAVWSCYLDEHDMGKAKLVSDEPSDEPTGVEVSIPFKDDHYELDIKVPQFMASIVQWLRHDQKPKLVRGSYGSYSHERPETLASTTILCKMGEREAKVKAMITSDNSGPKLLLGGFAYQIKTSLLGTVEVLTKNAKLVERLVLEAPIGLVQVAPSREELQYSEFTKKVLRTLIEKTLEPETITAMHAQACGADPSCKLKMETAASFGIKFSPTKYLEHQNLVWPEPSQQAFAQLQIRTHYSSAFQPNTVTTDLEGIDTKYLSLYDLIRNVFVVADPESTKEALKRIAKKCYTRHYLKSYKHSSLTVWFMRPGAMDKVPWFNDGSVDVVTDAAAMPEADENLFTASKPTTNSRGRITGVSYAQHGRKLVELNIEKNAYYNKRASSHWSPCKATDIKGGVYVVLDAFALCNDAGDGMMLNKYHLHDFRSAMASPGICSILPKANKVYGIRAKDAKCLKDDDRFEYLWDYVGRRFAEDLKSGTADADAWIMRVLRDDWTEAEEYRNRSNVMAYQIKHSHSTWLSKMAEIVAGTEALKGTRLKAIGDRWHAKFSLESQTPETEAWFQFVKALAKAWEADNTTNMARRKRLDKPMFDVGADAKSKLKEWFLNSGELKLGDRCLLTEDLEYIIETQPMLAHAFNLGALLLPPAPEDVSKFVAQKGGTDRYLNTHQHHKLMLKTMLANPQYLRFMKQQDKQRKT